MFQMLDALRRRRGALLDAVGFGPQESAYRIIAEQPGMRVRASQGPVGEAPQPGPALLILPAPFKRCYIWDLHPDVSVVRRCRDSGLQVFLLEWREPAPGEDFGLADYAEAFPLAALGAICAEGAGDSVTVTGHSLGGTFAAIFAALHPERVRDLWLIDAPVVFAAGAGDRFAAMLQGIDLGWFVGAAGTPVPGSLISALAAAALPDEFLWRPAADLLASSWDADRRRLHAQVLRWTLDEFPIPSRLLMDVAEQLYRQDCFRKGVLAIRSKRVGLADLRTSIAAVLNPTSAVVPAAAVEAGLRLARAPSVRIISHEPDAGCAIQHVGPLVSPRAHAHVWPELIQRAWSG
jgi:polyhydroxyalkanoate synthase